MFAFDATTGQSVWTQKLGAAVPSSVVPNGCANATPHLGVTSTPVIDRATARMYLVAQEDSPLRCELWTLDLNNGGAPISRAAGSVSLTRGTCTLSGRLRCTSTGGCSA